MKNQPRIRNALLVAALAAVTATAWATSETLTPSNWMPARATEATSAATPAEPVATKETLAPGETVVTPSESAAAPIPPAAPYPMATLPEAKRETVAAPAGVPQPPITIEERALSLDERIQAAVMDTLATTPDLDGKIGVESEDAVVTLTGFTYTRGQAWRAERAAASVKGVRYVQNQIRPRIGGSV